MVGAPGTGALYDALVGGIAAQHARNERVAPGRAHGFAITHYQDGDAYFALALPRDSSS